MDTAQLQHTLDVSFRDPSILRQALTHPSYVNEHPGETGGSNQRLEFLGDALVSLVVAWELYRRHPQLEEGALTDLRSDAVRGQTLAGVARRLKLGEHLLLGQGESASGGHDRDSNLAAALEALVGAVLVDRGYRAAQRFALRVLRPELAQAGPSTMPKDPKSQLQERVQSEGGAAPRYEVVDAEGPDHRRLFTVQVMVDGQVAGTGRGGRKVEAERQAAQDAMRRMEGDAGH